MLPSVCLSKVRPQPIAVQSHVCSTWHAASAHVCILQVYLCHADDHDRIREWVAYHEMIGVRRMYIYDDGSTPPMRPLLADFIRSGLVHYRYLTGPLEWGQQVEEQEQQPKYEGEGETVYYPDEEGGREGGSEATDGLQPEEVVEAEEEEEEEEEDRQGPKKGEGQEQRVYNDCIYNFRYDHTWLGKWVALVQQHVLDNAHSVRGFQCEEMGHHPGAWNLECRSWLGTWSMQSGFCHGASRSPAPEACTA
jgi:hypothetical protein